MLLIDVRVEPYIVPKAKGVGQLSLGEDSLIYWEQRLGWSPDAARYLATAFAFGIRENAASVLEKAQELSGAETFEERFVTRSKEDPSIIGPALEASKFLNSEELRDLLGRILAGDVAKPGSVSRRTVSVAQDLSFEDLQEFLKLRLAAWSILHPDFGTCFLILGKRQGVYGTEFISFGSDEIGVNYHSFGEFQQLGLLQERPDGSGIRVPNNVDGVHLRNGRRTILLKGAGEVDGIGVGRYLLTNAGAEILNLFIDDEFKTVEGYFEEVCNYFRTMGLGVEEVTK